MQNIRGLTGNLYSGITTKKSKEYLARVQGKDLSYALQPGKKTDTYEKNNTGHFNPVASVGQ